MPRLLPPLALLLVASLAACGGGSKAPPDPTAIPANRLYSNGVDALNSHHYNIAAQMFDLVEQGYPYSTFAGSAQLMQGYTRYKQQNYPDAIAALDRFIQLHPASPAIAYAYYLRALSFYEQIADIQRDQRPTLEAIGALQEVINRFPASAYARDAKLKIDLCHDHLAGHDMAIGRWYERQHLYAAAIGRYQSVVNDYQTTNHTAEALERLTEIYLRLGLKEEAKRTAAVLAYNYPGSPWYRDSYRQLAADGVITASQPAPAGGRPGFFGRIWNFF